MESKYAPFDAPMSVRLPTRSFTDGQILATGSPGNMHYSYIGETVLVVITSLAKNSLVVHGDGTELEAAYLKYVLVRAALAYGAEMKSDASGKSDSYEHSYQRITMNCATAHTSTWPTVASTSTAGPTQCLTIRVIFSV